MKASVAALLAGASLALASAAPASAAYHHVLLISVDGMHAIDLQNYVATHPNSAMAGLAAHGIRYPNALTTRPSDSFPGLLAQVTGGTSRSSGVFYDVSYDRTMYAPGSNCQGTPGWQPAYDESIDNNKALTNAGGTLGNVISQINPAALPMKWVNGVCTSIYPHSFLKTNTIFEVIKAAGLRTAWADKHPAYDLVNGPSGTGVDDLFTPEVNSVDPLYPAINDTTKGFHSVQRNDEVKVQAVLNEIAGKDSTGQNQVGVPAIFGMNFQAVSVGQKLAKGNPNDPADAGLVGGYADAQGLQPNNGLQSGLDYVDGALGRIVSALNTAGLANDTLIIISAKHGQSPIDVSTRIAASDDLYANTPALGPNGAYITDDVGLVWLDPNVRTRKTYAQAESYLKSQAGALYIDKLLDAGPLFDLYGGPFQNERTPDFIAITRPGVIYTGGSKLAEHGGFALNDRNVALLVSSPWTRPNVVNFGVETTQIAPTILKALGLDPKQLKAVVNEQTVSLPGIRY